MKSETPLDYAVFQLSPSRSQCELFVSGHGNTEKIASGLIKPFINHLKVAEEQASRAVQSIKLQVKDHTNDHSWFTKGTLERFVRFVSTPEILDLVNAYDAEMSHLESARRIYSQGPGDQHSSSAFGDGTGTEWSADETKKELVRAINVRLVAVKQDLAAACNCASAAGFNPKTMSHLQLFAHQFGAHHLNEACSKFISVCQRRPDLISPWKPDADDKSITCSSESDMSTAESHPVKNHPKLSIFCLSRNKVNEKDEDSKEDHMHEISKKEENKEETLIESSSTQESSQPARRISVLDRINLFENKQKNTHSSNSGAKPIIGKSVTSRSRSSDVSMRRWSNVGDMSTDVIAENKDVEGPLYTTTPSSASSGSHTKSNTKDRETPPSQVSMKNHGVSQEKFKVSLISEDFERNSEKTETVLVENQVEPPQIGAFANKVGDDTSDSTVFMRSVDRVHKVKESKGNQDLNDELKIKAKELEKIFAGHKKQAVISLQNRKPTALEVYPTQCLDRNEANGRRTGSSDYTEKFSTTPPVKLIDERDKGDVMGQTFSGKSFLDDYRGKSYERYKQKRDAKLSEKWGLKSTERVAKMKAMHDSLEKSRAVMIAKFSRSPADRKASVSTPTRSAEKLGRSNYQYDIPNRVR